MLRPATGCAVPHSSVSAIGNITCNLPLCCQQFIPGNSRGGLPVTVFVSYSSRDKDAVKSLTQDLLDADEQVWMDQRLAGGDAWWRAILEQIRGCDVFIFALSQNSIQSRPCQAELHYAQALGLPILPVQVGSVDSMQLNPLATVQTIDYRTAVPSTAMRLISALNRTRAQRQPLPSPLPDEPPVPFEYLIRLYTTIAGPDQLGPRDQAALVAQLQVGLREDGQHEAARNDIVTLLRKLRDREDVTYRTRTDVDAILASIGAGPPPQPPIATDTATPVESPVVDDAAPPPSERASSAKKWVGVSLAAVVVVVLAVIGATLANHNNGAPSSAPATSSPDQQLHQLAAGDRLFVTAQLADHWIPQLSSKHSTEPWTVLDGMEFDSQQILQEHQWLRQQYGAKLLWSGDWTTYDRPDYWVTIAPQIFSDSGSVLSWCTSQKRDSDHCSAHKLAAL